MIKRSWVRTPTPYTGWMQAMLAITYMKNNKNKGSLMGHTKKILKKKKKKTLKISISVSKLAKLIVQRLKTIIDAQSSSNSFERGTWGCEKIYFRVCIFMIKFFEVF